MTFRKSHMWESHNYKKYMKLKFRRNKVAIVTIAITSKKSKHFEKVITIVRYKVTTVKKKNCKCEKKLQLQEIISKFWRNRVAIMRKKCHKCEIHATVRYKVTTSRISLTCEKVTFTRNTRNQNFSYNSYNSHNYDKNCNYKKKISKSCFLWDICETVKNKVANVRNKVAIRRNKFKFMRKL